MFSIKWNNDNIEAACHLSLWGLFFQGRFLYMKSSIPVFPGLCDWSICSVPKGEIGDIKFSQLRTRQSIPLKSQKIKILQNDIQFTFFVHVKTSLMNILQQKNPMQCWSSYIHLTLWPRLKLWKVFFESIWILFITSFLQRLAGLSSMSCCIRFCFLL